MPLLLFAAAINEDALYACARRLRPAFEQADSELGAWRAVSCADSLLHWLCAASMVPVSRAHNRVFKETTAAAAEVESM